MKKYLSLFLMLFVAVFITSCGTKYARPDRCVCDEPVVKKEKAAPAKEVKEEPAPEVAEPAEEEEISDELAAALSDGAEPVKEPLIGTKPNSEDDEISDEMAAALSDSEVIRQAISNAQQDENKEIKLDFEKISKKGLFDFNSSRISKDSYEGLDTVAEFMEENPSAKLRVEGHTDSTGKKEYNQQLSEKRAVSVKNYLINKGVAADRITTKGFGASKPIASNATKEGRAQNRRTELIFKLQD